MTTRRSFLLGVLVGAMLVGAAYSYFRGRQYVLRFSEAEIRQALSERMPVRRTYLFIFEVTLDNPRVTLVEGSNRINAGLDVGLNIRITDEALPLGGSIDASGGLRYDAELGQLFLSDPIVERLRVDGVPEEYASRARVVMTNVLTDFYATHPIHTLDARDARQAAARLVLRSVVVEDRELVVTLGVPS